MTLMMISARMFLQFCAAQALTGKGGLPMEPQEDEMPLSGAMGRLSAAAAEKIGPEPVLHPRAYPESGLERA